MGIRTIINLLLAFFKAVPVVKSWCDELAAEYVKVQLANMSKENQAVISGAFNAKDQRPIENLIGSDQAGKPSNVAGSELYDGLPGMQDDQKKGS